MEIEDRIIGEFIGHEEGPLLIAIGGIHGNEAAGIHAIRNMLKMLEVEPLANPHFKYRGNFIGVAGNIQALQKNMRFLEHDMNRSLTEENVSRIFLSDPRALENEDKEIYSLIHTIRQEIARHPASEVYILDIHTTTADGGIFTIPTDSEESIRIAQQLHATAILGFLKGVSGTTLQYFSRGNLGVETTVVTFEAGQHDDIFSVHRAVSAIAGFMRSINSVEQKDVESHHDELLIEYAAGLPKLAELIHVHKIQAGDGFIMEPGFKNFTPVKKGRLLAKDNKGDIYATADGMVLMPLYQFQGEDGFFLIREVTSKEEKYTYYDMEERIL